MGWPTSIDLALDWFTARRVHLLPQATTVRGGRFALPLRRPERRVLLLNTNPWCTDVVPPHVLAGFSRAL
jgi:hypothetical protein